MQLTHSSISVFLPSSYEAKNINSFTLSNPSFGKIEIRIRSHRLYNVPSTLVDLDTSSLNYNLLSHLISILQIT